MRVPVASPLADPLLHDDADALLVSDGVALGDRVALLHRLPDGVALADREPLLQPDGVGVCDGKSDEDHDAPSVKV